MFKQILCPVNDPDCTSADDQCHDACEAPDVSPVGDATPKWYYENIVGHHCVFDSTGDQLFTVEKPGIAAQIVREHNAHHKLVNALQFFLKSLANSRRSGLSPAKDYSDWATVEFVVKKALAEVQK